MITLQNVTGGYNSHTPVVENLTLDIEKGKFFALLGPNGSGKTTIIRLIMGVLKLYKGSVSIAGRKIEEYKPKELARKVAVLSQENQAALDFTVQEIVELGRYPHQKSVLFRDHTSDDRIVVERVMKQTNCWELRSKFFASLSGGEKQRVLLAKALAQEPDILLLDEPTNHLDVRHTMELLDLMKKLQAECNLTILAILHDLNLASLYADEIALLKNGTLAGTFKGLSTEVQQLFSDVYGVPMYFNPHPQIPKYQIFYTPKPAKDRRTKTLRDYISVQENKMAREITFTEPLRTITMGKNGKGFTWENSWSAREGTDFSVLFPGNACLFGYNQAQDQCSVLEWDKEITEDITYILAVSEQGKQRKIGLLSASAWDDSSLINNAMLMTAQLTELLVESGLTYRDIDLIAISTISNRTGTPNGNGMWPSCEIERLIRFAAEAFNRKKTSDNENSKRKKGMKQF